MIENGKIIFNEEVINALSKYLSETYTGKALVGIFDKCGFRDVYQNESLVINGRHVSKKDYAKNRINSLKDKNILLSFVIDDNNKEFIYELCKY